MALTKDFKDTVQARARRDPVFRRALLQEGVECLIGGDVGTGKAVLRDYINATIGFEGLSSAFDKSSKSLMRMFGPKGNPQAGNLFAVIRYLQECEGVRLEVKAQGVADSGGTPKPLSNVDRGEELRQKGARPPKVDEGKEPRQKSIRPSKVDRGERPRQKGARPSKVDEVGLPRIKGTRLSEEAAI